MKQFIALFIMILLCSRSGFAGAENRLIAQFYDGEARPRAEVAWIWVRKTGVSIDRIDNSKFGVPRPGYPSWVQSDGVVEILPGNHIITVQYYSGDGPAAMAVLSSKRAYELQIDAKAGENYIIDAKIIINLKESSWIATITTFSPLNNDTINLRRCLVERTISMDGVVQSWKSHRLSGKFNLALLPQDSLKTREFLYYSFCINSQNVCAAFGPKLPAGQKVRVLYFLSVPDIAVAIDQIE